MTHTEPTINPATLQKLTKATWKRLAKLDDPEDAEELRALLLALLESLDAMTDDSE